MTADAYLDRIDNLMTVMLESWEEVSLYSEIFEESDGRNAQKVAAKNAEIGDKATGLLQKAITALKRLFAKLKEMVSNAIDYLFASKDEIGDFEDFVKEVRSNPELANTKVTLHDYRNILNGLNADCKKFENDYKKFKQSEAEDAPSLSKVIDEKVDKYGTMFKNVMEAEGASFAVEAMIVYAQQCKAHAIEVQSLLKFDEGLLDAIEKEIGARETAKFKKKLAKLNSEYKIVRKIYGGRQLQGQGVRDALKEVANVWHGLKIHHRAKKGQHAADVKKAEKAAVRTGVFAIRTAKNAEVDMANAKAQHNENKARRLDKKARRIGAKVDKLEGGL